MAYIESYRYDFSGTTTYGKRALLRLVVQLSFLIRVPPAPSNERGGRHELRQSLGNSRQAQGHAKQ